MIFEQKETLGAFTRITRCNSALKQVQFRVKWP